MYTHTFEILSQMMDALSFVLDTTEEWYGDCQQMENKELSERRSDWHIIVYF